MVSKTMKRWIEPTAAPLGFRIFNTCLMLLLAAIFLIPFYLIAVASFTDEVEIAAKGFQFLPKTWTFYNYEYLFGSSTKFFNALSDEGVNVLMISTSEIRIAALVPLEQLQDAVRALHTAYGLDAEQVEAVVYGGTGR